MGAVYSQSAAKKWYVRDVDIWTLANWLTITSVLKLTINEAVNFAVRNSENFSSYWACVFHRLNI